LDCAQILPASVIPFGRLQIAGAVRRKFFGKLRVSIDQSAYHVLRVWQLRIVEKQMN
jgi:hypothetical protein